MALPLSVAIVCRNNAPTIGRTLDSVRGLASEIVAVDSGSTDQTIPMLEAAGARIIRSPWLGHVRTKQLALESCTHPWILSLDSDESVEPELARAIDAALTRNDPTVRGYELNRKIFYAGRFLQHTYQPEWRLRLVRRGAAAWGGLDPHDKLSLIEAPGAPASVSRLSGDLRHDSWTTIADHLAKQVGHARISAESLFKEGRRTNAARLVISTIGALFKQIVLRAAWRDGWRGIVAAGSAAAGTLMKHAILLERQNQAPD
ncbi:MAG: glycosyltransferase family 2 protein [Phycisphaeraceae bacterium]|nr:glycosyltransferase family 2 protein [Phycisphaeraceae bacterium]